MSNHEDATELTHCPPYAGGRNKHAFSKKTRKTPVGDMELALKRKKEVM